MRPTPKQLAVAILLATVAVSCATPPLAHDSAAPASTTSTTVQPVQRGFHSDIVDVWLPQGATLDPHSNSKSPSGVTLEMWHADGSLGWSTKEMDSLLPVNQLLDGLPWCGSKTGSSPTSTDWAWGTSTDMVDVSVFEIEGDVMITISHGPPSNGVCQPGG
jgi:hypothetical protein